MSSPVGRIGRMHKVHQYEGSRMVCSDSSSQALCQGRECENNTFFLSDKEL
jgi:hypothetical protein